ncbi:peptidylglycine alpha-hydroxylating monooxygenase-like isoform X2 [Tachypleus tridentatus]|uniref:peptidylglycine alpha-hydroxylating monooxygenase-like isoform X2 n=1 Tax=Tachypleus tridentatus TaxID=6853 RepID=UPI003FD2C574
MLVAGYVLKPNGQWLLIGKHDLLKPQMFYPVQNNLTILQGDIVVRDNKGCSLYDEKFQRC